MRGRATRWVIAAALVAVAALAKTIGSTPGDDAGSVDPALETEVLARTIATFETRWAEDPGNPVIGAELADAHMLMFKLDNELDHLDRAETIAARLAPFALRPSPAHARLSAARLARHDFVGALASAETAVSADPSDDAALGTLFDAALAAGRYDRAEWALEGLEAEHAGTLGQRTRTSRWLDAMGDPDAAFATLHRACGRLETRAVRRQIVAWCEAMLGDLELGRSGPAAASRWYRRALDTQPEYMAALEGLADLAYAREAWGEALDLYLRILADAHPDLSLRLAEVSRGLGDEAAAEHHERRFWRLATAPGAEALNAHTLAIYLAQRAEMRAAALSVIERDLERRRSVEALEVLAWVRMQRGELDAALEASDAARAWGTPSATSDYTRGRILTGLGFVADGGALLSSATRDPSQLDHHVLVELRARAEADAPPRPVESRRVG